jgi:hypothetical protein
MTGRGGVRLRRPHDESLFRDSAVFFRIAYSNSNAAAKQFAPPATSLGSTPALDRSLSLTRDPRGAHQLAITISALCASV